MFVELREFDKELVRPEKIAAYETESGGERAYLTFGHHLGPVVYEKGIGGEGAKQFHNLAKARFNFPKAGYHYLLSIDELYSLLNEWRDAGISNVIEEYVEFDIFYSVIDGDNLISYFWGGE